MQHEQRSRRFSSVRPVIEPVEPRLLLSTSAPTEQITPISAVHETAPVANNGDAADDIAVWVNPDDRARSAIIGTDKRGAINVYNLDGTLIQTVANGDYNGVDLRTGFRLGGRSVILVAASERDTNSVRVFTLDPTTRQLTDVTAGVIDPTVTGEIYGMSMYHDSAGRYYGFVTTTSGNVQQFRFLDNGLGQVTGQAVRNFDVGGITEGLVVDDEYGFLFISEENVGLWRYGANPLDGDGRLSIDTIDDGNLNGDLEGLALYTAPNGKGYLIVSDQGMDEFVVYDRAGYTYITRFKITAGNGIDAVTDTDGIEVVSASLGGHLSEGVFIAQDDNNTGGNQNFKLVSWGDIARAQGIPLLIAPNNGPGTNHPPIVYAGPDVAAQTFSHTIPLYGTVSDLKGPLRKPIIWWEVLETPAGGAVTFRYEGAASTPATFSVAGTYRLRLGAYDGQVMSLDELTVTAGPFNTPPVVDAGADRQISIYARTTDLSGLVSDDGLTNATPIVWWEVLARPRGSTVSFRYEGVAATPATFSHPGTYVLRLGAYDGDEMTLDTVSIQVLSNQPPVVNAGPDVTLSADNRTTLAGSISDDGGVQLVWWEVLTQPAGSTATLTYQGVATTPITFSHAGTYVLRLGAYDGTHMTLDEKVITVLESAL